MPALPRLPRSWRASAVELVAAGLWSAVEDGWLIVEWCEPEVTPELELSAKRAEAGRRGGLAKASKTLATGPSKPVANTLATDVAKPVCQGSNGPDPSSPLELSSPDSSGFPSNSGLLAASSLDPDPDPSESFSHVGAAKPKRRWRRCPAEWAPTEEHRQLARERGVDFETELAKFRDHEFATGKSDANGTFRNWLRNARATGRQAALALPARGAPGSNFERQRARVERLAREEQEAKNAAQ